MVGFRGRQYRKEMRAWLPLVVGLLAIPGTALAAETPTRFGPGELRPAGSEPPPSRFWILGGVGFGFGTGKLEGLSARADATAGGFITEGFGVGAMFEGAATGMPDGDAAKTLAVVPQLVGRIRFPSTAEESALVGSIGVGWVSVSARPRNGAEETASTVMLTADLGALARWKILAVWGGVVVRGVPGYGVMVDPQVRLGFAF